MTAIVRSLSTIIAVFFIIATLLPGVCAASPESQAVSEIAEHMQAGRLGEAVREAEAAADRQWVHPDISFNRGLAYLTRAKSTTTEPGDLGQAAAGFAETLQLSPDDAEAERGLEQVQLLVAQDRSGSDASPESSSLGLFESVLLGISQLIFFALGGLGSALTVIGLLVRRSNKETRVTTGGIVALVGVVLLLPSFVGSALHHHLFREARIAVVIADRAEVVDDGGGRIPGRLPYRQGTVLLIGATERGMTPLINFGQTARVPAARLRILAQPPQ